jgi:hypothetical protein
MRAAHPRVTNWMLGAMWILARGFAGTYRGGI